MKRYVLSLVLSAGALAFAQTAHAATLVDYTFESTLDAGTGTASPASVDPGVTASDMMAENGSPTFPSGNDGDGGYLGKAISLNNWTTDGGTGNYFEFTVTPKSGNSVSLSDLKLDERASTTGPKTFDVVVIDNLTQMPIATGTATDTSYSASPMHTITISGAAAGPFTGAVSIRFDAAGATSVNGTWRLDNVVLDGTVSTVNTEGGTDGGAGMGGTAGTDGGTDASAGTGGTAGAATGGTAGAATGGTAGAATGGTAGAATGGTAGAATGGTAGAATGGTAGAGTGGTGIGGSGTGGTGIGGSGTGGAAGLDGGVDSGYNPPPAGSTDNGGCSCRTAGGGSESSAALALLLGGAALVSIRRRRR